MHIILLEEQPVQAQEVDYCKNNNLSILSIIEYPYKRNNTYSKSIAARAA